MQATFNLIAIYPVKAGYDIRMAQEFLGRRDVKTTMSYTHSLNREPSDDRSQVDGL